MASNKDYDGLPKHIARLLRREVPEDVQEGVRVYARKPWRKVGRMTGNTRHCRLEGCPSLRIEVRWSDGKKTRPCLRGMERHKDGLRII